MTEAPNDDSFSDEIKREDSLERYWLFSMGNGHKRSRDSWPRSAGSFGVSFSFLVTRTALPDAFFYRSVY